MYDNLNPFYLWTALQFCDTEFLLLCLGKRRKAEQDIFGFDAWANGR